MFSHPQGNYLKVYLDGYRKNSGAQPPELEFIPGSFLDRHQNLDSYSSDSQDFWYLQLAGHCNVTNGHVHSAAPKIKQIVNSQGPVTARLLGQLAIPGQDPIPEHKWKQRSEVDRQSFTRGLLRILGLTGRETALPPTRKHELFIPYPEGMENAGCFPIPDEVWDIFHSLANLRTDEDPLLPFHVQGSERNGRIEAEDRRIDLRDGDLVYFDVEDTPPHSITAISLSSIWRKRVGTCFEYFIEGFGQEQHHSIGSELLPYHPGRRTISIAEQIFGFVEDQASDVPGQGTRDGQGARALMGRVRFSPAVLRPDHPPDWFDVRMCEDQRILKILSSPKPPSRNFYFELKNATQHTYIRKSTLKPGTHIPKGRKAYVHRQGVGSNQTPWFTKHPHDELKQKLRVSPLRKGLTFYFHVDFENLALHELSLLVYGLRPDPDFRHKIGLGKPVGLGAIDIEPVGIFYIDRGQRYSIATLDSTSARYHAACVDHPGHLLEALYPRESRELNSLSQPGPESFPSLGQLWDECKKSVPVAIHRALRVIGRESAAVHPVHTPQVGQGDPEIETYQWFVRNDGRDYPDNQRECLKPITGNQLSTLRD